MPLPLGWTYFLTRCNTAELSCFGFFGQLGIHKVLSFDGLQSPKTLQLIANKAIMVFGVDPCLFTLHMHFQFFELGLKFDFMTRENRSSKACDVGQCQQPLTELEHTWFNKHQNKYIQRYSHHFLFSMTPNRRLNTPSTLWATRCWNLVGEKNTVSLI